MQKRLDAYAQLVREQDRMIEELKALNSKLIKEKEALLSFRRDEDDGDDYRGGAAALAHDLETTGHTPKSKEFVQSLVGQLRDEKRQRLAVEEQSSRMIGEQQLTIHRLEEKLKHAGAAVLHVSPHRNSNGLTRQGQSPSSRAVLPLATKVLPTPSPHVVVASPPVSAAMSRSSSVSAPAESSVSAAAPVSVAPSTTAPVNSMEDATAILQEIRRRHGL